MRRIAHHLAWLLLAAATLAAAVAGRLAWAQQAAPRQPAGAIRPVPSRDEGEDQDVEFDADAPRPQQRQQQLVQMEQLAVYRRYFDRMVFVGLQGEDDARQQIEAVVAKQVDHLERACGLTDSQKKKLHAAGQGDIKRFFDGIAEARKVVHPADDPRILDRNLVLKIRAAAAPLVKERAALLAGEGPIFTKATRHTLTPEQLARFDKDARDRLVFRHRAAVRWAAVMLARSLGLTDDQRRRLESVLLEQTRPPLKFGTSDYMIVMCQAARIPEARIRPIFDDLQWRVMADEFAAYLRWEVHLKQGGFLPLERVGD
jgi:hypothetical protein